MNDNEVEECALLFNDFVSETPDSISILLAGKTGVGKSALVNSLIGKKVAKEGAGAWSCTTKVKPHKKVVEYDGKCIDIILWDSPGYEDEEEEERREDAYFNKIKGVEVDILLFCIPLSEKRWRKQDEKSMKAIHKAFGPSIWKKAMFALTQANMIEDSSGKVTNKAYAKKLKEWDFVVRGVLERMGVKKKTCDNIVIVPTGNFVEKTLPGCEDWFAEFWTSASCTISPNKRVPFLLINRGRIHTTRGPLVFEDAPGGAASDSTSLNTRKPRSSSPMVAQGRKQRDKPSKGRAVSSNTKWNTFDFGRSSSKVLEQEGGSSRGRAAPSKTSYSIDNPHKYSLAGSCFYERGTLHEKMDLLIFANEQICIKYDIY